MKRSVVNHHLREAETFFEARQFHLPPFAYWTPDEWARKGPEVDEIRQKRLGWDLTDLGSGDYENIGLLLFTLRNGNGNDSEDSKCYAEKIMIVGEGQVTPWHFHWTKTEDIINRGGGNLVVEVAWSSPDESALDLQKEVWVACDGVARNVAPGSSIILSPGESITLPPMLYHSFFGARGRGSVLVGEVSTTNDDRTDNRFLKNLGRFPAIEEDEPAQRLLCSEYPGGV